MTGFLWYQLTEGLERVFLTMLHGAVIKHWSKERMVARLLPVNMLGDVTKENDLLKKTYCLHGIESQYV